jgi:cell division topological specificity factor
MHDLLRWLLNRTEHSKDTARNRLQLVLLQDRIGVAPDLLETLKNEIMAVVSRYMVVGEEFLEFEIRRLDKAVVLVSNIKVEELNRLAPAH